MKILLIGNYEKDHQYSMQKFTDCLFDNLTKQGFEVRVCKPQVFFARSSASTISGFGKWLGYIDKYLLFPFILKKQARQADLIHICDHSNAVYVPYIKNFPHLITCHDLMAVRSALGEFKENDQVSKSGQLQQKWIVKGLRAAKFIASVSESTRNDLINFTGEDSNRYRVIHLGLNYPFTSLETKTATTLLNKYSIENHLPFLLHIGGNQWYKNRLGLIHIFQNIIQQDPNSKLKLILAGKPLTQELQGLISEYKLENQVIEICNPTTEELKALYSLAEAFIFPSIYEGFGWPIIEALACNTLVFTSNRQPMNEIGGQAAIYINPDEPATAAQTILKTLSNRLLVKEIKAKAPAVIKKFNTETMINNYISFYQSILEQNIK